MRECTRSMTERAVRDRRGTRSRVDRPRWQGFLPRGAGWHGDARERREIPMLTSDMRPAVMRAPARATPQGVAPTAQATCRHVGCQGNDAGKCSTMRRTDRSIHTATLSSRSRSVVTCAVAQAVPGGVSPQRLHQDVGRQREQEPELIAAKARAAQPVQGHAGLELLDPVLDVPARAVDRVDVLGGVRADWSRRTGDCSWAAAPDGAPPRP